MNDPGDDDGFDDEELFHFLAKADARGNATAAAVLGSQRSPQPQPKPAISQLWPGPNAPSQGLAMIRPLLPQADGCSNATTSMQFEPPLETKSQLPLPSAALQSFAFRAAAPLPTTLQHVLVPDQQHSLQQPAAVAPVEPPRPHESSAASSSVIKVTPRARCPYQKCPGVYAPCGGELRWVRMGTSGLGFFGCCFFNHFNGSGCCFRYYPHECISYPVLALEMVGRDTFRVRGCP